MTDYEKQYQRKQKSLSIDDTISRLVYGKLFWV